MYMYPQNEISLCVYLGCEEPLLPGILYHGQI